MLTVTRSQALQRWDELPLSLREALYSEENSDFLWKTCEEEHIPKEKIPTISKIVGWVLMGFLHVEDFSQEVSDQLQIDKRVATAIGTSFNTRIFAPLRPDIDKAYKPLSKLEIPLKTVKDIEPSGPAMPTPAAPKPNLAAAGWSKLKNTASAPKPAASAAPKSITAPTPAPVIIHEDAALKPQTAKPDFHIAAIRSEDLELRKTTGAIPLKPAVLELGKVPLPKPGVMPTARVVHYDEFKEKLFTNIPMPGVTGAPQRNVTEVTTAPKPSTPPLPTPPKTPIALKSPASIPTPTPKPPAAPTKMAEEIKVIQKDYL